MNLKQKRGKKQCLMRILRSSKKKKTDIKTGYNKRRKTQYSKTRQTTNKGWSTQYIYLLHLISICWTSISAFLSNFPFLSERK